MWGNTERQKECGTIETPAHCGRESKLAQLPWNTKWVHWGTLKIRTNSDSAAPEYGTQRNECAKMCVHIPHVVGALFVKTTPGSNQMDKYVTAYEHNRVLWSGKNEWISTARRMSDSRQPLTLILQVLGYMWEASAVDRPAVPGRWNAGCGPHFRRFWAAAGKFQNPGPAANTGHL